MGQDQIAAIFKKNNKSELKKIHGSSCKTDILTSSALGNSGSATPNCCHYVCK